MTGSVSLPVWVAAALFLLAGLALVERLVLPGARWVLRRRVHQVLDEVDARLRIRIQPFKLTRRQVLIDRLLGDAAVLEGVERDAREEGSSHDRAFARAARYAEEIVPAFNAWVYFRAGYWIARQAARSLYRVRLVSSADDELAAVPEGATVVFLMNHRSNMDYVLVSYLVAEQTALSYAVGEWARIWPLETLFRAMGAYFIRRNSKNALYRRVLERYVAMATAGGVTQAVYLEGGLTRDGALRPPRLGILDYMVRGFDPAGPRDVAFVPVGLNYDRVLEDRSLLAELDPAAPRQSTAGTAAGTASFVLKNLALAAQSRWHRFGYACVNIGRPVSLRSWLVERSLDPRLLPDAGRKEAVAALAGDLMRGIAAAIPVLPVPLVATAFVRSPGRAFTELELKTEVLRLAGELEKAGARLHVPRRDLDYAITAGLRMLVLRRAVLEDEGLLRASAEEGPLLGYYASSVSHLFASPFEPGLPGLRAETASRARSIAT
jgi:glycerol-3-phosphate O-acyltransferase